MRRRSLDGFCEFDSQVTNYKITRSPFGRDVCAELARAVHQAGMRLGFYYSPPDWHHPDFFTENHGRYVEYLHRQVRGLLTNYGQLDILWFDADGGNNLAETWNAPRLNAFLTEVRTACQTLGGTWKWTRNPPGAWEVDDQGLIKIAG